MPAPFTLKLYQEQSLTALGNYLAEVAATGDADTAFYKFTRRAYHEAPALPGLPYICLRVPTGGGKDDPCGPFGRGRGEHLPQVQYAVRVVAGAVADNPRPDACNASGQESSEPARTGQPLRRKSARDDGRRRALREARRL